MSAKKERERRREERLERQGEAAENERRQRLIKIASAAGFLAIIAVVVLVVVSQSQTSGGDTSLESVDEVERNLVNIPQDGLTLGRPTAKVTLVEFGDLQCPICRDFAVKVLPELIASKVRSGEAAIEYRNYPILGPESETAAAAAIAAAEQDRGWEFIELFYKNQGIEDTGYVTDGLPDLDRQGRKGRRHSALEPRPRNRTRPGRGRTHDRRGGTARVRRHALICGRRAGDEGAGTAWKPGNTGGIRRSDRSRVLIPGSHNRHYRALNQARRVALPSTRGRTNGTAFGISSSATLSSANGEASIVATVSRLQWHPSAKKCQGRSRRSCQRAAPGSLARTCSTNSSFPPGFRIRAVSASAAAGSGTVQRTRV